MTLNSKEFVETIIEHASTHGFPVDTERQPNFWKITEKGGSFETRFSQMLGWFLTPTANHGCGIDPLQAFLDKLAAQLQRPSVVLDPANTTVHVEKIWKKIGAKGWDKLDLLIVDNSNEVVLAIEVKMNANDHEGQLENYYYQVVNNYPSVPSERRFFAYLTPDGREPSKLSKEGAHWEREWKQLSYDALIQPLEQSIQKLEAKAEIMSPQDSRVVHLLEDLHILIKEKGSLFHSSIRNRFVQDRRFENEIACAILATSTATPAAVQLQMKARDRDLPIFEYGPDELNKTAVEFWEEVRGAYSHAQFEPKRLTETGLISIVESIWQVIVDEFTGRETNANLDLYLDLPRMSGVQGAGKWFRDELRNTPNTSADFKVMVVGQGRLKKESRNDWTIGVGPAEVEDIPYKGRRGFIRFNAYDSIVTLESKNNASGVQSHQRLIDSSAEELRVLGAAVEHQTNEIITIRFGNSEDETTKQALLGLVSKACFSHF